MFFVMQMGTEIKVGVLNRVVAKLIDLFLVFLIGALLPYPIGPLAGFSYSILCDGFNFKGLRGQSIGKRLLKLQVINKVTGKPASWRDSLLRNSPVGIATFFGIIPIWGWLILALIGLPLMIMEVYLIATVESGHRLGDVMADTEVIEQKKGNAA